MHFTHHQLQRTKPVTSSSHRKPIHFAELRCCIERASDAFAMINRPEPTILWITHSSNTPV